MAVPGRSTPTCRLSAKTMGYSDTRAAASRPVSAERSLRPQRKTATNSKPRKREVYARRWATEWPKTDDSAIHGR